MKKYKVKSHAIELQVYASRVQKSDCTLLCLHGGPGSGAWPLIMQEAMQTLIKEYHCVFYDQRGCGLSNYDITKGIDFHDMLADIQAIASSIKHEYPQRKLILFGVSFGGTIAMQCVDIFPELFDGLIVSGAVMTQNRNDALRIFEVLKKRYIEQADTKAKHTIQVLNDLIPEEFFHHPQISNLMLTNERVSQSLRHIVAMSNWLFQIVCEDIIRRLSIPTLIMQGSNDSIAKEGNIIDVLIRIKNPFIIYETFPESGHEISVDEPRDFVERIKRFLKEEFPCAS